MVFTIKKVVTRTEFEAIEGNIRLSGTYEKTQEGQLTSLSASAHNQQNVEICHVEGYIGMSGTLRYNYQSVTDSDLVAVRALVVAVAAVAEDDETSAQGGSPALNNAAEQEGGSE